MRIIPSLSLLLVLSLSALAQDPMDDGPKAARARWCEECRSFLAPKDLVEKHRCPHCKKVARRVETTTVKVFACAQCGRRTECPRECCGAPVQASSVRAAVIYRCGTCGATDSKEGPCPAPGCRKLGRPLEREVELPHDASMEK